MDKAMQFSDINKEMFANETIKGLNFIDLISQKYDVVATNPPYLGLNKTGMNIREYLKNIYPISKNDMYMTFIERCLFFTVDNGFCSMITMQNFMFLHTGRKLRKHILDKSSIRKIIHLGTYAFIELGDHVNGVMVIYKKEKNPDKREKNIIFCSRLVNIPDKYVRRENILNTKYHIYLPQRFLTIIQDNPFIYWVNKNLLMAFERYNKLSNYVEARQGIITGDNEKYLRYLWEINDVDIGDKWILYAKGGEFENYFGNIEFVIDWSETATQNFTRIRDKKYHFRQGVTYTLVGSKFNARLLENDTLCDAGGSSVFSNNIDTYYLIGFLNSNLAKFFLSLLNPTVNWQAIDILRLPYKEPSKSISDSTIVFTQNETNLEDLYKIYLNHIEEEYVKLHTYEAMIDKEIFDLYEIDGEDLEQILREQGTPAGYFPVIEGYELIPEDMLSEGKEYIKNLERKDLSGDELNKLGLRLKELYEKGKSIEDISIAFQINPISVAAMRKELGLINAKDLKHEVENLLTYLILGQLKKDKDGIIPISEATHEEPLIKRLIDDLEELFGDENVDALLTEIKSILDRDLESWLSKEFFKKHISQYKKRPIIWQVKSKGGNFDCLLYYHKLDSQALLRLKHQYLSRAIEINNSKLGEQKEKALEDKNTQVYQMIEKLEAVMDDLKDLDSKFDTILSKGYDPVIDDGVMVNIAPLQDAGVLGSDVLSKSQINKAFTLGEEMRRERAGGG
jgi:hypothetical protein